MSDPMLIGLVCEGITDFPVLEAVIKAVLGPDTDVKLVQPDRDNLRDSAGFHRVKAWCERRGPKLRDYCLSTGIHLFVVHVDADIARRVGASTTRQLCDKVKGWLKRGARSARYLVVIPAQAIEAWLLAAHVGVTPELEDVPRPVDQLLKHRLLTTVGDEPYKDVAKYEELAERLRECAPAVRSQLPELNRFCGKLEAKREQFRDGSLGWELPEEPPPQPGRESKKRRR